MIIVLHWYDYSPEKVKQLKKDGCIVLLDFNLWDIPNTMEGCMKIAKKVGADYMTILENGKVEIKKL
jgi:orotidine-5'-phosphate decarboxylase